MFNTELQYLMNWNSRGILRTKYFETINQAQDYTKYFSLQGSNFQDLRLFDRWNKKVIKI